MKRYSAAIVSLLLIFSASCLSQQPPEPYIIVLGNAQDGGYPHLGCMKECCTLAWKDPGTRRMPVSLALVDPLSSRWYLFEATPDIREQLQLFREKSGGDYSYLPEAIFVSHAHIGHYTGLMELGREVMNSKGVTVYLLPRMKVFLETNGPWSQLVDLNNIQLCEVGDGSTLALSENVSVNLFTVPHRDEFSETAGYSIETGARKYLFIPDIDKWDRWETDIKPLVKSVDIAFLDGTFYGSDELPGRNMDEVPHPFVTETIALFRNEPQPKGKILFIHMNHTNPLIRGADLPDGLGDSFGVAEQGAFY